LRHALCFSTMPAVQDDSKDGSLRNTLYQQRTRSGRTLTRARLLLYRIIVPVGLALVRVVWSWARVVRVVGSEHIERALQQAPSFIPVYWHQHQLFCVKHLLGLRGAGLRLGFLISPSVDGEIGAMLVRRAGAHAIRGSSTHTGARALRDYYQALVKEGLSPAITPDGPRGPPWKAKPGAILLSQMSQRAIIPLAYAASRAWMIKWDRFVVPWPGARIAIAIGPPLQVPKGLTAERLDEMQVALELRLRETFFQADSALKEES
jgi:lysophospholipid acyltransferase (LPLAT)-like uncharacterized protein